MVTQLILATGFAIIVSALCSIIEAVLYSVPQSQVEVMANTGKKSGLTLKELKRNIQQPITAILTLNTSANTMGAAVAGAWGTVDCCADAGCGACTALAVAATGGT